MKVNFPGGTDLGSAKETTPAARFSIPSSGSVAMPTRESAQPKKSRHLPRNGTSPSRNTVPAGYCPDFSYSASGTKNGSSSRATTLVGSSTEKST